jgi:hypothetical protein
MTSTLRVVLGLQAKGFNKSLSAARRRLTTFNKALGLIGLGASVGGLMRLSQSALTLADDLGTAAAKLGVTTDFLQELQFAAEQSGVGADTATMAFQRFSRRLAQAQQGGGELHSTLQDMGIAMFNADGTTRQATDVLNDFADGLKATDDPSQRLLRAFKAFDSEGVSMLAVLGEGSEAFNELRRNAHEAGVVLEEEHIANLDKADKSLKRFGQQAKIGFAKFVSGAIRAFKIGQKFFEYLFDQGFRRLPILKNMLSNLLRLDFKGFNEERDKLKSVTKSIGEIYSEAEKTVDSQLSVEEKLTKETEKRRAIIEQTTKQIAEQQKLQNKIAEQQGKLNTAKRDRSLLTLDELAAQEGVLEKRDPHLQRLRKQLEFAEKGLSPTGGRFINKEFERSKLLGEKASVAERLGEALARQGLTQRSQRAFALADQLRKMTPHLKSAERDPFKVMTDQLQAAKDSLEELKKQSAVFGDNFPLRMQ